jgi:2,3-dihydro-2,3-dihydroxybenzoate dehydrogenase
MRSPNFIDQLNTEQLNTEQLNTGQLNTGQLDFANQVIVVTGAAQGIGAAVARSLVQAGATVAGLDIQPDKLEALQQVLGVDCFHPYPIDVSDELAVDQGIEHIEQHLGPIVGLVNGAGILKPESIITTTDVDWQRTFAINTTGVFHVCRSVARVMIPRVRGAIVTISSNAAHVPRQNMAAYAASKAAATHFTRCLGLELAGSGIRCNTVSPGSTDTPMQQALWTDVASQESILMGSLKTFRTGIPLGRIASPEDIADSVLFLLSDRSCHITMQDLQVDGGATLGV